MGIYRLYESYLYLMFFLVYLDIKNLNKYFSTNPKNALVNLLRSIALKHIEQSASKSRVVQINSQSAYMEIQYHS